MAERDDERSSEHYIRDIREDIATTRHALEEKVDALGTKARQIFDLEHHMQVHPLALLGASTGAGFLAGALLPSASDDAPQVTATSGFASRPPREERHHRERPRMDSELAAGLKVAALSLLAGFVRRTVRQHYPGWADELDRVWSEQGIDDLLNRRVGKHSDQISDPVLSAPLPATKDVQ